jgi:hypothetical protein
MPLFVGHIDWNIAESCNMSCTSCSHAAPVAERSFLSVEQIERDLLALKPILRCHSNQLVGGEPLLNPNIVEIMRLMKRVRMDLGTVVITNGTLLPRMPEEFWQEMEYLSISVYPVLKPECLELAREKQKQYGFGLGERVFTEFHRQFRKEPNDGSHFATCHWKSDCYTVHDGAFYLCPQSVFFPHRFMGLEKGVDGLPLAGITEDKLNAFLHRTEPLIACRICMANEMKPAPWQESPRKQWLEESKAI